MLFTDNQVTGLIDFGAMRMEHVAADIARLLGSLSRTADREVTFLRVMPLDTNEKQIAAAERELRRTARDNSLVGAKIIVTRQDSAVDKVAEISQEHDLTILGVQRIHRREKAFSHFGLELARRTSCPLIFISRRG